MNRLKNFLPALLLIALWILYVYKRPLAENILRGLSFLFMTYFGFMIIRNRKRHAENYLSRFGKSSPQGVLNIRYREKPLRLTITLAGLSIMAIGFMGLVLDLSKHSDNAFEGFGRIAVITAVLVVMSSGLIAIIAALFMLKRR